MGGHEDRRPRVLGHDHVEGLIQFVVVALQVGREVRCQTFSPGPATFAQVDPVRREPARCEEIGEVGVEEVVRQAVDDQDDGGGIVRCVLVADEGRGDLTLTVWIGTEG